MTSTAFLVLLTLASISTEERTRPLYPYLRDKKPPLELWYYYHYKDLNSHAN